MLAEALLPTRPSLDELCLEDIRVTNECNKGVLKGRIAEALVRKWLGRAPVQLDGDLPRSVGQYSIAETENGISVWRGTTPFHEFDCLFYFQGQPYIGEVKAFRVKSPHRMIEEKLSLGDELYGRPVKMAIFMPVYGERQQNKRFIESE